MKANIGLTERIVRVWGGVALILFAFMSPDIPFSYLGWIGVIPLITGLIGWCGIYKILGISTSRNSR